MLRAPHNRVSTAREVVDLHFERMRSTHAVRPEFHDRLERTEELAKHNFFDELMELRDKQRKRSKGMFVVKGSEIPLESNRHGLMQWYMHPNIEDVSLNTKLVYVQHIPPGSKSGRQHHPGQRTHE